MIDNHGGIGSADASLLTNRETDMPARELIPMSFKITSEDRQMMIDIQEHYGLVTMTAAVRFALKAMVDKIAADKPAKPKARKKAKAKG